MGALDFKAHQLGERGGEPSRLQVVVSVAEAPPVRGGKIYAADGEVAGHVLPKVGKLQAGANAVRQFAPCLVMRFAQVQDQAADRIGGIPAIAEQLLEGVVTLDTLVLLERN